MNLRLFFFLSVSFISKFSIAQNILFYHDFTGAKKEGFHINGWVTGIDNDVLYVYDTDLKLLDSSLVKNGRFTIKGKIREIQSLSIKLKSDYYLFSFFIENTSIDVQIDKDAHGFIIKGGKQNELQKKFHQKTNFIIEKIDELKIAIQKAKAEADLNEYIRIQDSFSVVESTYINLIKKAISQKEFGFYLLNAINAAGIIGYGYFDERIAMMKMLPPRILDSYEGKLVYSDLINEKINRSKFNHLIAYNFQLKDQSGRVVRLQDFRNKYVVLDFWASWCEPCLKEMPLLKKIYENVLCDRAAFISISIDKIPKDWIEMESKLKPLWISLLDDKEIFKKYNVNSVPNKILISPKGEIIAFDMDIGRLYKLGKQLNFLGP